MSGERAKPDHRIERFDSARHDRSGFSSGVISVDNFFRGTANKLSKADNLRLFVMASGEGELIGFVALNAHAVDYADLPRRYAKYRPAHGSLPAAFISMIGVDVRFQGRGHGGDLLVDALKRISRAADEIGIAVVMLDVLDSENPSLVQRRKSLYEGYGFQSLPSRPLRLFLPIATVKRLIDI